MKQRTVNGDAADIEACDDDDGALCLETADDKAEPLLDSNGNGVPDTLGGEGYGVLNRSRTNTRAGGALVQLVDKRALFGGENQLTLGASYDRSHTRFDSSTELGQLTEDRSVTGLGPVIAQPDGSITPVSLNAKTRYTGVFIAEKLPLFGGLSAELGVRWNQAKVILDDRIGTVLDGNHKFTRVNPGAELDWEISPALSFRGGYAETNRAPTPAELACADAEAPCSLTNFFVGDPPLKQVVAKTWELGASGKLREGGWKIDWLVSGYRATNHNDIQFVASKPAVAPSSRTSARPAGRASRRASPPSRARGRCTPAMPSPTPPSARRCCSTAPTIRPPTTTARSRSDAATACRAFPVTAGWSRSTTPGAASRSVATCRHSRASI